jgi:hypothetical protein
MLSGAAGVIDIMLTLCARTLEGGSYHTCVGLTFLDTIQLDREVGLYPPETVKKNQDKHRFTKMTLDLHVEKLLYVMGDTWVKNSGLLTRKGYMVNLLAIYTAHHADLLCFFLVVGLVDANRVDPQVSGLLV